MRFASDVAPLLTRPTGKKDHLSGEIYDHALRALLFALIARQSGISGEAIVIDFRRHALSRVRLLGGNAQREIQRIQFLNSKNA